MTRRLALLLWPLLAALTGLPAYADSPNGPKLRIGVEGAYPPFSEVGRDGQVKGFEVDLARDWCRRMGRECELVKLDFDGMIPALQARRIDAIVASLAITEARRKAIAFSKSYYSTPQTFIARVGAKPDISPAALKGKRIGVQSATVNESYVAALYAGSTIQRYTSQDQVYLDLTSGRLDYSLVDKPAAEAFMASPAGKGIVAVGPPLRDPRYFGVGVGVGVRKADEKTLGAAFNAAIDAARADGSFKRLNDKYFPYDISPP